MWQERDSHKNGENSPSGLSHSLSVRKLDAVEESGGRAGPLSTAAALRLEPENLPSPPLDATVTKPPASAVEGEKKKK